MISTGAFLNEMDASNKQHSTADKFAAVWEKKNAKAARAGGVSLMALSLAACGGSSSTTSTSTSTTTTTTTTATAQAFDLTAGFDTFTGGAGDDTFTSTKDGNYSIDDTLVGGAGSDTLFLRLEDGADGAVSLSGIETVDIRTIATGSTLTLTNAQDVDTVVHNAGIGELTISGAGATTGVEIKNQSDTDATTLNFKSGVLTGTADTVNVALNGNTGDFTLTINDATGEIDTLAITGATANTGSTVTLAGDALDATSVTIGGAASIDVSGAAITSSTIDASANSGGVKVLSAAASGDATITGGSGNDRVDMTTSLDADDTIVGGAGEDTIVLDSSTTARTGARVTGFEVVQVGATGQTFDNDFLSVSKYVVEDGVTAATLTDLLNNTTVTLQGDNSGTLTTNIKTNTSSDVLNLVFADSAAATQTLAKLEGNTNVDTLNITSGGGGANTITAMDLDVAGINITGAQGFTITGLTNNAGATEELEIIDASALTGALSLTLTNADNALTVTGSATAANTVVLSAGNDIYVGGSGVDIVTGAAGDDTMTGGAGADDFILTSLAATGTNNDKDIIKDFTVGTDDIDLNMTLVADGGASAHSFLDVAGGAATTTITGNRTVEIFEFSAAADYLGEGVSGTFNAVTATGAELEAAVIEQIATDVAVAETATDGDDSHLIFAMYDESGNAVIVNFTDATTGTDIIAAGDFFEFVVLEGVAAGTLTSGDFI